MTNTPDKTPEPSTVLWKGYNADLQLDMTIIQTGADEQFIYSIVKLDIPDSELEEAVIQTRWKKDTILAAISNGEFEQVVNNCYINMQVEDHKSYIAQKKLLC